MKYYYILLFIFLFTVSYAQTGTQTTTSQPNSEPERGEVYFKFRITDRADLEILTRIISLDNFDNGICWAYANQQEFAEFKELGIDFEILPNPGDLLKDPKMLDNIENMGLLAWDYYPTYSAYVTMMYQFAATYPGLCQVFSFGTTIQGRQLLMAKISDNVGVREAEPQFLYTGSMHGDELTGGILLLRLIDYLLANYGTNAKVTNLVNNVEIWINPLANPDGTYYGGDNTVTGARRGNYNNIDLNRNYPDPQAGQHPDGYAWQVETVAFMNLAQNNHFVLSMNTHGGAEVINYPWDTWSRLTPDNSWWVNCSRQYVDTVHLYSPSTYMDFLNNGITNGYAWYQVTGGRQDYMNYFHHCREITAELSDTKTPAASLLPTFWEYNYRSLLNYIELCLYGVRGIVTDSISGLPLAAKVEIVGFDADESFIYAAPENGNYHRMITPGTYNLTFTVPGYLSKTVNNVQVIQNRATVANVQLNPGPLMADFQASATSITVGKKVNFTNTSTGNPASWQWTFQGGTPATSTDQSPQNIQYTSPGTYPVKLKIVNAAGDSNVIVKSNYITVNPVYLMQTGSFVVNSGTFYDSGGESANYANSEDYTFTLKPTSALAKVEISFLSFDVQSSTSCTSDYLSIYNGLSTSSTLIGKYCGTNSPGTVLATNGDGALTFVFHSNTSTNRPGWKANISCKASQTVALTAGWSGISSFIQPDTPALESLLSPIGSNLIILQNWDGMYYPGQSVNTLGSWNTEKGYMIKILNDCQLQIPGHYVSSETIALQAGWNILPVKSDSQVSVSMLANLYGQNVVLIKEIAGTAIYWPEMGISTLNYLTPGKAYYLKASQGFELDYRRLK